MTVFLSESAYIRTFQHISSTNRLLIQIRRRQFAASSHGIARPVSRRGAYGGKSAERGKSRMLTARVTFGLGGLLLVNVVLLAVQMALGVNYLPV
ncbi:MAG TPA: hypothetical protein VFR36_03960 [Sphingomicrobium sp.]|nr:hypothetical protein [Sphingomicrobium sp.]